MSNAVIVYYHSIGEFRIGEAIMRSKEVLLRCISRTMTEKRVQRSYIQFKLHVHSNALLQLIVLRSLILFLPLLLSDISITLPVGLHKLDKTVEAPVASIVNEFRRTSRSEFKGGEALDSERGRRRNVILSSVHLSTAKRFSLRACREDGRHT